MKKDIMEIVGDAVRDFKSMTYEQQEDMMRKQRDNYVKSELELSRLERQETKMFL